MTTIRKILLTLALAAMAAPAAAREAQLMDPGRIHLAVADGPAASATKVRNAIVLAGIARGWTLVEEQPGRLKLTFNKADKHRATIEVHYDERSYDIRYVDSYNLNYAQRGGQAMIHPNYNRWVNNLAQDARMFYTQGGATVALPASAPK